MGSEITVDEETINFTIAVKDNEPMIKIELVNESGTVVTVKEPEIIIEKIE